MQNHSNPLNNRVRVIGAAGPFVRIEVDGKPITITERDAVAVAAGLLKVVFQDDPEGYRLIVDALRSVHDALPDGPSNTITRAPY